MEAHMSRAVLKGSKASYNSELKNSWAPYRASLVARDPGEFLERVPSIEDKCQRVLAFHDWMYDHKAFRPNRVSKVMSALRDSIRGKGMSVEWLADQRLVDSKNKSCAMSTEETRVHLKEKEARVKLGLPLEVVEEVRRRCVEGALPGSAGLDSRACSLAISMGVNDVRRMSNLVLPDGPKAEDHAARYGDFKFKVETSGLWSEGLDEIDAWISGEDVSRVVGQTCGRDPSVVSRLVGSYPSDKTSRSRGGNAPMEHFWGRDTPMEGQLVTDLVLFLCDALPVGQAKPETKLLTRLHNGRLKVVTRKEAVKALQDAAEGLGLDRSRFSAKSLRLAGASHGLAEGVPTEAINAMGDWAPNSNVATNFYSRRTKKVKGVLALGNADPTLNTINLEYTKDVIQRLARK